MNDDSDRLRESVQAAYSAAATEPDGKHPFPVGSDFAESVGYPAELLSELPGESASRFAGVSNVSIQTPMREGTFVVDLGCGAGLDSLIAARRVGNSGRVVGIDFSTEMLVRARRAAIQAGIQRVLFVRASAELLPLPDSSVDLALVNGLFNLNPYRQEIFHELGRIIRPGGSVAGAELILRSRLPEALKSGNANWFS